MLEGQRQPLGARGRWSLPVWMDSIKAWIPSEQEIALRHRQLAGRLATEQLAVGPHLVGFGIDFESWQPAVMHHVGLAHLRTFFTATSGLASPRLPSEPLASAACETKVTAVFAGRRRSCRTSAGSAPAGGRDRGVGVAHRRRRDHPALDDEAGLDAEEGRRHSTRSASLPTSTEPTSWAMPWVMAGLMVYLAT